MKKPARNPAGVRHNAGLKLGDQRAHHRFGIRARLLTASLLACLLVAGSACNLVHKSVEVEKLLTPLSSASTQDLIAQVNRLANVKSIHGKVDIQFEDTSFATAGIAEKYRAADGSITLQRPAKVYLVVQGPLAIGDVAQMTSDGEHFRIAVLKGDEKYRRFVRGTNNAIYQKLNGESTNPDPKGKPTNEAQAVKALSNLRPQHLTDALLLRPIDGQGFLYARSEFFNSEKDPTSKKRVVRGYYLLDEIQTGTDGSARLRRRFWFDRVGGIRLARQQNFDDQGALVTDVSFGDIRNFGSAGTVQLPVQVSLTRPQDHYKITMTYQTPESVTIDRDWPAEAFVLENKWQLPEVDLDVQKSPTR